MSTSPSWQRTSSLICSAIVRFTTRSESPGRTLETCGAGPRIIAGQRDFWKLKDLARGIGRLFAADVAANEGNARAGIRLAGAIAGLGGRNKGARPTEKANDASVFVSWLLGHATHPTRIGAQGAAIIQSLLKPVQRIRHGEPACSDLAHNALSLYVSMAWRV